MKRIDLIFIAMVLVSLFSLASSAAADQSNSMLLFNGKDLAGWKVHGTEKWYVKDGLLVCENGIDEEFGYLVTQKHYKNFELTLEYKQENKGNSGIFVRSTIEGTSIRGWQVEIALPGHKTGGVHEYNRGWLIKPNPEKDKAIKIGEWNKMKVVMKGATLTSWLNDTQMATITDAKIGEGEGSIALQIHGGNKTKVKWRNIKINEFSDFQQD